MHNLIDDYFTAVEKINRSFPRDQINKAVELLFQTWKNDGTVFLIGNGGSASTASHFACDLGKFAMVKGAKRLKVVSLVDNIPLVSALTNDNGFSSVFAEQLEPWIKAGDVLIALSVHGGSGSGEAGPWSQNIGRAVELARLRKARILGFSGFNGGMLARTADICLVVPADTEPMGTAVVESYHVLLHHLICCLLRDRIQGETPSGNV